MPVVYEVAAGLFEGARKYGRHNWRRSRVLASVYYDAALRHLAAWWEGEDIDPDSGIPHLSKAMAGLMVLRDAQMTGQSVDDRPSKSPADWMAIARELVAGIAKRVPEKV